MRKSDLCYLSPFSRKNAYNYHRVLKGTFRKMADFNFFSAINQLFDIYDVINESVLIAYVNYCGIKSDHVTQELDTIT